MHDRSRSALVALRRILRVTDANAKAILRASGLTPSQLIVLQILEELGEATPSALASRLSITQATMTTLIDRLERRQLVQRRRGESDRRKVWVHLTQPGRQALIDSPDSAHQRFTARFDALPDWEQAFLIAALERVATLLDAEQANTSPVLDAGPLVGGTLDAPASPTAASPDDAPGGLDPGAPADGSEMPDAHSSVARHQPAAHDR